MARTRVWGAAVVMLLTSACSPDSAGEVGLTVDSQGRLVALIAVCHGYLDGVTVYRSDTDNSDDRGNDRGEWVHNGQITSDERLTLAAPEQSWTAKTRLRPLEAHHRFAIYAHTKSSDWTAGGPEFRVSDLRRLDAQHVLIVRSVEQVEKSVSPFALVDRFHDLACGATDR